MKKLTTKQRQHRVKPPRKAPPRPPTPPRQARAVPDAVADIPSVDSNPGIGFLVRLPDEPNPLAPNPERWRIPVYIGWKGRALHVRLALLFATRKAAEEAAAAFPHAKVRFRNIWDERGKRAFGDLIEVVERDPLERERMLDWDGIAADIEWDRRLRESLVVLDDRAPQDPASEHRIIDTIRFSEPMVISFEDGMFDEEQPVFEQSRCLIPPGLV